MKNRLFAGLRALAVPLLGSLRYACGMAVLVWVWFFDARLLNAAFDMNVAVIKWIGAAGDGSGRPSVESRRHCSPPRERLRWGKP